MEIKFYDIEEVQSFASKYLNMTYRVSAPKSSGLTEFELFLSATEILRLYSLLNQADKKIAMIKSLRTVCHCGLKEAKEAIEKAMRGYE